jgi:hypothetical protein
VRLGVGERVGRARVVPRGVEARAQELADAHDDLLEDRFQFVVRWCVERLEADLSMLADEDTVRDARVEMDVEIDRGAKSLNERNSSGPRGARSCPPCSASVAVEYLTQEEIERASDLLMASSSLLC